MQILLEYAPGQPPGDPKQLPRYLQEEFRKLQAVLANHAAGHHEILYVAPAKPRPGMEAYADGTTWNPGSGEGLYRYSIAGAWGLVGRSSIRTVATLPAAAANEGAISYVTDANATTRHSIVAAGGANKVLVYSDGTNWLIV